MPHSYSKKTSCEGSGQHYFLQCIVHNTYQFKKKIVSFSISFLQATKLLIIEYKNECDDGNSILSIRAVKIYHHLLFIIYKEAVW